MFIFPPMSSGIARTHQHLSNQEPVHRGMFTYCMDLIEKSQINWNTPRNTWSLVKVCESEISWRIVWNFVMSEDLDGFRIPKSLMAILTAKLRLKPICVGTAPKKAPRKLAKPRAISLPRLSTTPMDMQKKRTSKRFLSVSINKDHLEFYGV